MFMNIKRFILLLILALALFLRFWQTPARYGIGYDGSRDALVAFESARSFQLPLTGSFSSIGPITFGPWYYWIITFSNFIIPSPWAPWILIGLSSLMTVYVMYKIGVLLENETLGLILALLASISPAQINSATPLQQHALIGFFSSLAIFILLRLNSKKNFYNLATLWGFVIGIAINTHFQAAGLIFLPIFFFIFSRKIRLIPSFLMGLFFSMIPILIFELNNHWFNTRNILDYIFIGQYRVWTSNRWLTFAGKFIPEFWAYTLGAPFILSMIMMVVAAFLIIFRLLQKKLKLSLFLISISFAVLVIMLRYYRGEKFFGYLQFFHPYIFIFNGYVLYTLIKWLKNLYFRILLIIIYIAVVLPSSLNTIQSDKLNMITSNRLNQLIKSYPNKKFSFYDCVVVHDVDRIQALILLAYMQKAYDKNGYKIAMFNSSCNYTNTKKLSNDIVDVNQLTKKELEKRGLEERTAYGVYAETARWWFKEQP